jgi:hypothetical protein
VNAKLAQSMAGVVKGDPPPVLPAEMVQRTPLNQELRKLDDTRADGGSGDAVIRAPKQLGVEVPHHRRAGAGRAHERCLDGMQGINKTTRHLLRLAGLAGVEPGLSAARGLLEVVHGKARVFE